MTLLKDKKILLAVTGSIAAYKAAHLTRLLVKAGAQVQVVMSPGAQQFITTLTLQALSGRAVRTSLWDEAAELGMGHIELARWADLVVVAPASADAIARLAQGRANDLLTTLLLASTAPVLTAPAMNHVMWAHPATQNNIGRLQAYGYAMIGPVAGELAERETGLGRMAEPEAIYAAIEAQFSPNKGKLLGKTVVVSAGPTREAIDPVRFLSNRATGRMGFAIARACAQAKATTYLVAGPSQLETPAGVERIDIESAGQMYDAVMGLMPEADIFISAAAVADYRPVDVAAHKIKKQAAQSTLELTRTQDIIAAVAERFSGIFTVGFAAETQNMQANARDKLQRKKLNMVAGNIVGPEAGFAREDNALFLCWPDGEHTLPTASKQQLAENLVTAIAQQI